MKLSVMAIFVLVFASCGRSPTGRAPASLLGSEKLETGILSGLQKSIATNICYEFASKDISWRNSLVGQTFNFDIEEQTCGELPLPVKTVSTTLVNLANSQQMLFDPAPGQTILRSGVDSDRFGTLAAICPQLTSGNEASNTSSLGGETLQYVFHQKSVDFDGYTVLYFKPGASQAYKEVVTELELSDGHQRKGLEKVIRSLETCTAGGTASNEQTYIP